MKLLIIEDEQILASLIQEYFLNLQYKVNICFNCKDGLNLISENKYDIIILDYMLPNLNGFKCIPEIKEYGDIPIIMLTAKSDKKTKIETLKNGVDDYITKPFDFEELEVRIENIYKRTKKLKENILKYKDIKIDVFQNKVFLENEEVILNFKEYELLLLLIHNKNNFLSKNMIENELYGNEIIESNVIEVLIYSLRKKFGKFFIKTYRNLGYRLS